MSLMENQNTQIALDDQLQRFIEAEKTKRHFQELVYGLTDVCWEICMDKPSSRLEPKVHKCLVNCVERFIDTTNYITNRLERVASSMQSESDNIE
ncbi:Mitochondrial import inner membrane translocase subunit Tim8 A [Trachymyrmex septentrionalis]|uniref:Mitochondrial import inner membrane translocase subunit n=1 Tax=Trachymyrmex septentrionalis TaxID=34720 RepID=A0A195EQD3_9HYME|nr:PREDICTED: mitochondrial import inner membrane translocase subunit Tim8 A-like [Trachymyrmex septentrionalis]XP_018355303.1 PREDICTED: mitochondrial import inner membrane translocase subunit Tim8 A-like [Trachymyrmex septentrionalis]KYN30423.1 Mitochondrial import inner membrane translocase subunit Tim8 A [Trachymyrmex septentrionalis]